METPVIREHVGIRIRELIYAMRLNNNSFAAKIGMTPMSVINTANGKSKPRFEMIQKILAAFPDVNENWLISGTGEMFAPSGPEPTSASKKEDAYLQSFLKGLEEKWRTEYSKILDEKNSMISQQKFMIETLMSQLNSALGKLDLSEEILPVSAKIVSMPSFQNVA